MPLRILSVSRRFWAARPARLPEAGGTSTPSRAKTKTGRAGDPMAAVHSLFLLRLAGLCRTTLASAGLPADSLEEMRQIDVENVSDLAQGADTDVLLAAFDGAGKGTAESGTVGEVFLRPAFPAPQVADALTEILAYFYRVLHFHLRWV